jgi:lipoyl(octanoyl) transferase
MKINIVNLGRIDYKDALNVQEKLHSLRQQNKTEDILLLLEHSPVLTLGRRGSYGNILLPHQELEANGISIYEVTRGGDVTYHGPGQIVGYPIIDLNNHSKNIKDFVWKIEEIFIRLLKVEYNIVSDRDEKKYTGVWVGNNKITAIGIAVKRWVTMHGFAFNVNTNLEHFKWINPCGITDKGVVSLQKLMGHPMDFDKLNAQVADYFCKVFALQAVILSPEQLHSILEIE